MVWWYDSISNFENSSAQDSKARLETRKPVKRQFWDDELEGSTAVINRKTSAVSCLHSNPRFSTYQLAVSTCFLFYNPEIKNLHRVIAKEQIKQYS